MADVEKNPIPHKPEFAGEWVPFDRAFAEVSRGVKKFGQNEYLDQGEHPIIDQGKNAIAGYSNEQLGMFKDVPAIVFGDHTRVFKYVDRPFFIGADGVKILKPLLSENVLFWYYALCAANIENLGYSRHFKLLKEKSFLNSSHKDQASITQILETVDEQISLSNSLLSSLDNLVKSQFVEMFGDTYSNSKQLPSRKLGALIDFITSGSRGWSKYYSNEGDYFITIKNVRGCSISLDNVQHVHAPNNKEAERTKVQSGDVLISITADLGRTGVVSTEIADHGAYINQHLACIRLAGEDILPLYLSFFLESPGAKDQLQRKNQTGVKAGLNFDLVKSLDILVPPLALQQQFSDFVARVDKLGFDVQQQIEKLETLKRSLMQEYFG